MYCERCGKYSGQYPLCKECYYDQDEDDYDFDDEFFDTSGTCLICQEATEDNTYFFCKECYYKYRNKVIHLEIKRCKEFKILDAQYDGIYRCYDGHMVKSKSEREIDNFLFRKNIRHCYEKPIHLDESEEHDIHPDFYLHDLDLYIEHLGKEEDPDYNQIIEYKAKIYKKLKLTVIFTHECSDAVDMSSALERKLKNYKRGQLNFL